MKLHSFDVYDTLLTRRVAMPVDLFQIVGMELQSEGLIGVTPTDFAQHRAQAEIGARHDAQAGEVQFIEIYQRLAKAMNWNSAQTSQAMELELKVESQNTEGVPGMAPTIAQIRAAGFRVIFISDMYLPATFIGDLLRRHGFLKSEEELFVSNELRHAKHDGRIFPLIRNRFPNVTEWRHTGDHHWADLEMPRRHGIAAQLETRCALTRHERFVCRSEQPWAIWRSQLAAAMKLARLEGAHLEPPFRSIWQCGTDVVGPLWFGFAEWCLAEALRRGIKRLYFVARDGQIFHKVATEIARQRHIPVECRYLYGSRQAWHLSSLQKLDENAYEWIFNRQRYLTTEQVMRRVGLSPENFPSDLAAIGIQPGQYTADISPEQDSRLRQLLRSPKLSDAILQQATNARNLTIRYLEQEGVLDGTPSAFVDIGWHGNMQRSLGELLRTDATRRNFPLTGFYFGLRKHPAVSPLDQFIGYWPESNCDQKTLQALNLALLEMMAAADHSMVLGFRSDGNLIKPIFDGERNEAALKWGLTFLQDAVVQFTKTWLSFTPLPTMDHEKFQTLTRTILLNFITAPSRTEADVWAEFPHSGEQIERNKESIAPALSSFQALDFVLQPKNRPAGWWVEGSLARK
jgi:predicted HAD superfamily hydrolase